MSLRPPPLFLFKNFCLKKESLSDKKQKRRKGLTTERLRKRRKKENVGIKKVRNIFQ